MGFRWGVLSTAKIGLEKVIPGIQRSAFGRVTAIASRDPNQAGAAAAALGIPVAYGTYDALLADPEIDAIYNPLPNHLHVPWTKRCLEAGKPVLCEKPLALTAVEAQSLQGKVGGERVMEAFMIRHHPQWHRARALVASGALGTVRAIQVAFAYNNTDPANIRNRLEAGGGALADIGCYAVVTGRFLFAAEPLRALALVDRDPSFGTDRVSTGVLDFGAGRRLDFTVATQSVPYQRVQVYGTDCRLELEIPFNAPQAEPTRLILDDGSARDGSSIIVETIAATDQYANQADDFVRAVQTGAPLPYDLADAICNMRALDALTRSERNGRWEMV